MLQPVVVGEELFLEVEEEHVGVIETLPNMVSWHTVDHVGKTQQNGYECQREYESYG